MYSFPSKPIMMPSSDIEAYSEGASTGAVIMKRRNKVLAAGTWGIAAGTAVAVTFGNVFWDRASAEAGRQLHDGVPASAAGLFSPDELVGLPAPVVRYFTFVLTPGQPRIQSVRIEQAGEFRIGGFDVPFRPFTA